MLLYLVFWLHARLCIYALHGINLSPTILEHIHISMCMAYLYIHRCTMPMNPYIHTSIPKIQIENWVCMYSSEIPNPKLKLRFHYKNYKLGIDI